MEKIIDHLYVGSDKDDSAAASRGFSVLVCAKDGPWGHRHMLGYTSLAAPKGPNYYFIKRGNRMALNLIDSTDPNMIPEEAINAGLKFVKSQIDAGKDVLIHCNAGHSRGPTTTLMYLRTIGEMPSSFHQAESKFKTLYPPFDPNHGMEQYARSHWAELKDSQIESKYTKEEVKYEDPAKMDNYCRDCIHFQKPNQCEIVQGIISSTAWCNKFERK